MTEYLAVFIKFSEHVRSSYTKNPKINSRNSQTSERQKDARDRREQGRRQPVPIHLRERDVLWDRHEKDIRWRQEFWRHSLECVARKWEATQDGVRISKNDCLYAKWNSHGTGNISYVTLWRHRLDDVTIGIENVTFLMLSDHYITMWRLKDFLCSFNLLGNFKFLSKQKF